MLCLAFFVIIIGVILLEQPVLFGSSTINTNNVKITAVDKININTALKEELMLLEGIGDKKADAIIDYRNKNGSYKNKEQLKEVNGISDKLYNQIKDFIIIE